MPYSHANAERAGRQKAAPDDRPHYAAKKAIGPKQLNEEEAKNTARRAFRNNSGLTSSEIGKAIGRSRRTAGSYIADLRAAVQMDLHLKIFRMHRLGIPQARIAKR